MLALSWAETVNAADAHAPASSNTLGGVHAQDQRFFRWQVKGPPQDTAGNQVMFRGLRHVTLKGTTLLRYLITSTREREREAAIVKVLKNKELIEALNNYQRVVEDIRGLVKSKQLGAVASEEFFTPYTREAMELGKKEFLQLKKEYLGSVDPDLVDKLCLLMQAPVTYLHIQGELPESIRVVPVDDQRLMCEWGARALIVGQLTKELEAKLMDYKRFKTFSTMLFSAKGDDFLKADYQEVEELIGQFRDMEAQKWARTIVALHKEIMDLHTARNDWMVRRVEELARQIDKGKSVYAVVGYRHCEDIRDGLSSGRVETVPRIEDSGVMKEVQGSAARKVISALLKSSPGTFNGWETTEQQDKMVLSGPNGKVTFDYLSTAGAFVIQVQAEGLFEQVRSATKEVSSLMILEAKNAAKEYESRLVVETPMSDCIVAAERIILKKLKAEGIGVDVIQPSGVNSPAEPQ